MKNSTQNGYIDQYIRFIVQNGYIDQYIRFTLCIMKFIYSEEITNFEKTSPHHLERLKRPGG